MMPPERDFSEDLEGANASPPPSEYKARLCYRLRHQFPHETFLQAGSILIMLLVVYGSLTLAIGSAFRPPGAMWALSVLWVCSHAAGFVASRVGLPVQVGMLLIGLLLQNVGAINGLPSVWSSKLRLAGLAVMLLITAMRTELQTLRTSGIALTLGMAPWLAEAALVSVMLGLIMKLPVWLAILGGCLLAATGPCSLTVGMAELQRQGYGAQSGLPGIISSAAGLDVMLAVVGFSIVLGLAIPHHSLPLQILHGPISLAVGTAAGAAAGMLTSMPLVWASSNVRMLAGVMFSELLIFCGSRWGFVGSGCVAILMQGVVARAYWKRPIEEGLTPGGLLSEGKGCEEGPTDSSLGGWPGATRAGSADSLTQQAQQGTAEMSSCLPSRQCMAQVKTRAPERLLVGGGCQLSPSTVSGRACISSRRPRAGMFMCLTLAATTTKGLVQPLFFALMGAALDFGSIAGDVAPKAVGIVAVGLAGRVAAAVACLPMGLPLDPPSQQRMFAALALLSKGAIQGALSAVPLELALRYGHQRRGAQSLTIVTTAVLGTILAATISWFAVLLMGPRVLPRESQDAPQPKRGPASGHNPFLTSLTDFGIRSKGPRSILRSKTGNPFVEKDAAGCADGSPLLKAALDSSAEGGRHRLHFSDDPLASPGAGEPRSHSYTPQRIASLNPFASGRQRTQGGSRYEALEPGTGAGDSGAAGAADPQEGGERHSQPGQQELLQPQLSMASMPLLASQVARGQQAAPAPSSYQSTVDLRSTTDGATLAPLGPAEASMSGSRYPQRRLTESALLAGPLGRQLDSGQWRTELQPVRSPSRTALLQHMSSQALEQLLQNEPMSAAAMGITLQALEEVAAPLTAIAESPDAAATGLRPPHAVREARVRAGPRREHSSPMRQLSQQAGSLVPHRPPPAPPQAGSRAAPAGRPSQSSARSSGEAPAALLAASAAVGRGQLSPVSGQATAAGVDPAGLPTPGSGVLVAAVGTGHGRQPSEESLPSEEGSELEFDVTQTLQLLPTPRHSMHNPDMLAFDTALLQMQQDSTPGSRLPLRPQLSMPAPSRALSASKAPLRHSLRGRSSILRHESKDPAPAPQRSSLMVNVAELGSRTFLAPRASGTAAVLFAAAAAAVQQTDGEAGAASAAAHDQEDVMVELGGSSTSESSARTSLEQTVWPTASNPPEDL